MEIREITGDKRRYLPLLLVGDEQEEMVMRYLPHGSLFVCFDPDPCAVAVVTDEGDGCCELKNLAVEPCRQRQGSLTTLCLLSKRDPLRWALVWVREK